MRSTRWLSLCSKELISKNFLEILLKDLKANLSRIETMIFVQFVHCTVCRRLTHLFFFYFFLLFSRFGAFSWFTLMYFNIFAAGVHRSFAKTNGWENLRIIKGFKDHCVLFLRIMLCASIKKIMFFISVENCFFKYSCFAEMWTSIK